MFLVGLLQWWYGRGWKGQLQEAGRRLGETADFFSIGQLAETLFLPFRQISANDKGRTVGDQFRVFFDKTISRVIGSIVRLFTILAGILALLIQSIVELLIIVVWLVLPLFPVIGALLFAIGWVPSWT